MIEIQPSFSELERFWISTALRQCQTCHRQASSVCGRHASLLSTLSAAVSSFCAISTTMKAIQESLKALVLIWSTAPQPIFQKQERAAKPEPDTSIHHHIYYRRRPISNINIDITQNTGQGIIDEPGRRSNRSSGLDEKLKERDREPIGTETRTLHVHFVSF